MLEVSDLEVRYGAIRAVRGVSLSVAAGELAVLLGANGAGKSSTLKAIAGLSGSGVFGETQITIDNVTFDVED